MTVKVLGFVWNDASELYVIEKDGSEFDALEIRKSKLVPVVSLEALKKWAKDNSHINWAEKDSFKLFKSNAKLIALHQLLSWAKKEALK